MLDAWCPEQVHSDGCVVLRGTEHGVPDASTTQWTFDEFLAGHSMAKAPVELFEGWPKHRPSSAPQYVEAVAKAQILASLAAMGGSVPMPQLRIQAKPMRSVFATIGYATGKLVLVPETSRIGAGAESGGLQAKIEEEPTIDGSSSTVVYHLLPMISPKFACPAWAVRTTDTPADANMEVTMKRMKLSVGFSQKSNSSIGAEIPVLVNSCPIKPDQELLIYRAPVAKTKTLKRDLSLKIAPATKSARK